MVTRTLISIADRVTPPPQSSDPTVQSTSSTLQRSLDQLQAASLRIDRILIEERTRANDLNNTPSTNTSDAVRQLRESTSALLNSLPSIPSPSPSPFIHASGIIIPIRGIGRIATTSTDFENLSVIGYPGRRQEVYHIVAANSEDTVPSTSPAMNIDIQTSGAEDEETVNLLRGWGRLDRNGDQILPRDLSETGVDKEDRERVAR